MKLHTALRIIEITALPLFILVGLMIVSGYSLVNSEARKASLVLNFNLAYTIHLGRLFRILLILVFSLHSYTGIYVLAERRFKDSTLKSLIIYSSLAFLIYVIWVALIGELT